MNEITYDLKDLRAVMFDNAYLVNKENDLSIFLNKDIILIAEKMVIEDKDKYGFPYYAEFYTECITENDLSFRISDKPITDNPKMFSLISRIPFKYLTEEEIKSGKITVKRIYKVMQDINISKQEENNQTENKRKLLKKNKKR